MEHMSEKHAFLIVDIQKDFMMAEGSRLASRLKVVNNIYYSKDQADAFSNDEFDRYLRNRSTTKVSILAKSCNEKYR